MNVLAILRSLSAACSLVLLAAGCGNANGSVAAMPAAAVDGAANAQPAGQPPAPLVPPRGTIYVGAYVAPTNNETPQEQIVATQAFEASIGRKLAIDMHYHLWSDTLVGAGEQDDAVNGRIPLVSWSCIDGATGVKDADIAAGVYDAAIAKRALAIAAFGKPIFLRYKWEMNLLYNTECADPAHDVVDQYGKPRYSPIEYVAAWQHIRQVFAASNVTNVVWLWNPAGDGMEPAPYYPGDAQVDWVGFDYYDTFNLPFQNIYTLTVDPKTQHGVWTYPYFATHYPSKPLMIGETGAGQAFQPAYFNGDCCNRGADETLRKSMRRVRAYVYWSSIGANGNFQLLQAIAPAFAAFASHHYESAMSP